MECSNFRYNILTGLSTRTHIDELGPKTIGHYIRNIFGISKSPANGLAILKEKKIVMYILIPWKKNLWTLNYNFFDKNHS